jgi:hypothetical protein
MQTLSIYNGGFKAYPIIIKKAQKQVNENLLTNKSFRLSPGRRKLGSTNNLKLNLGIRYGNAFSFNTPFISGADTVIYNNRSFRLSASNSSVSLIVSEKGKSLKLDCWDLSDVTKALSVKNHQCDFINDAYIKNAINQGKLSVKFKVVSNKNHGTDWKLN